MADYRDLWTTSSYYNLPAWRRKLDFKLEQRLLRTATPATSVSEPLATELRTRFAVPSEVVSNGFDPVQLPPGTERVPLSSATCRRQVSTTTVQVSVAWVQANVATLRGFSEASSELNSCAGV